MTTRLYWGLAGAVGLSLVVAACGTTRESGGTQPRPLRQTAAVDGPPTASVTTADGTEQFSVPASGRAALAQRLVQLVPGRITDARISNGWRTAAAAQAHPNDYAACVSASSGHGTQVFLIVKSGPGTGDVLRGDKANQRCADHSKVTQWMTLPEAVAQ